MTEQTKILVGLSEMTARRAKTALGLGAEWKPIGLHQGLAGFRAERIIVLPGIPFDRQIDVDWVETVLRLRLMPGGIMEVL